MHIWLISPHHAQDKYYYDHYPLGYTTNNSLFGLEFQALLYISLTTTPKETVSSPFTSFYKLLLSSLSPSVKFY